MITPKVDPSDDLFGHVYSWMLGLAQRVDRLIVVGLWSSSPPLPANASFVGLGKGVTANKAVWLSRLQRVLATMCLGGRVDAVLAHMGPIFAVAAAPITKIARLPLFLWYAHGHVSPMLRLAHVLADGIGTSTPEGFRIPSSKVTITGQGIDTDRFAPALDQRADDSRILSVGRYSAIKDYETLLDAFGMLRSSGASLDVVGGTHSAREEAYVASLRARALAMSNGERVRLLPGLRYLDMPNCYRSASIFATCSRTGSLDKAVLEAAACGLVPLVCNDAFRGLFGGRCDELSFGVGSASQLATKLERWLGNSDGERLACALALRADIERDHSVTHWADAVVDMIGTRISRR